MPRRKKNAVAPTIEIACGWVECTTVVKNESELNAHLALHLTEYATEEDHSNCPWNTCDFWSECFDELQRHVYYHGYYNALLMQGKYECEANPKVPKCCAREREGDKVPDIVDDFRCEWTDCERTFQSIVEFQDHVVQHAIFEYEISKSHEDQRPKTRCHWNYCKKVLDNKYRLLEHITTHSNRKHFACYHCGDLFRTKTTLFDHLRRQPDNNTHQHACAQCFKWFATEKLLRYHVVKHVYRYKCTMCDMTCHSASALAVHFRYRHLNDKPFKCTVCDHRCVREGDLVKHIHFVHATEVHKCDQPGCNYSVRTYSLLRRHFWEEHGNNPVIYICDVCDKAFKNGKSLSSHLIKKHDFQLPSGHKRFTYRVDENGFHRVQLKRIESLDVTKQILSPNPFATSDVTQDSSCYEIVSMTNGQNEQRVIVSNDVNEAHLVGEVVISLPKD